MASAHIEKKENLFGEDLTKTKCNEVISNLDFSFYLFLLNCW